MPGLHGGFTSYIIRRVAFSVVVFFAVIILNFLIPRLMPGDPIARLILTMPQLTPEQREILIARFGLDKPLHEQFILYIVNMFKGDFGISYLFYPEPVTSVILDRLPWTIALMSISTMLSSIIGIFLGMFAGWRQGSKLDLTISYTSLIFWATPTFWLGMVLLLIFGFYLGMFPLGGITSPELIYTSFLDLIIDYLHHSTLPIITLTLVNLASYVLVMRNSMVSILGEDFIVTAKAKGLPERQVLFKHAARNAILPTVTLVGLNFGFVAGGAVLTETVFSYPGIGRLMYVAVAGNDYPLIQGIFFMLAVMVILANFITDLIYVKLDPRVKYGRGY